jgi:hypothetical protein
MRKKMREKRGVFFAGSFMEDFWVLCESFDSMLCFFMSFRSTLKVNVFFISP